MCDMSCIICRMEVVAICALMVCAASIALVGKMHAETIALLRETLAQSSANLSRAHGSLGMALTEAASRTATAIGEAVAVVVHPPVPPVTARDEAYAAARDYMADDARPVEPDDLDIDPTDEYISPERPDLAVMHAGQRNPTGLPGFAFDLPADFDMLGVA